MTKLKVAKTWRVTHDSFNLIKQSEKNGNFIKKNKIKSCKNNMKITANLLSYLITIYWLVSWHVLALCCKEFKTLYTNRNMPSLLENNWGSFQDIHKSLPYFKDL